MNLEKGRTACLLCSALTLLALLPAAAQDLVILSPREAPASTVREYVNILGRTVPGASARVAGTHVPVYATGVFVRDRVPLQPGLNRIAVEVRQADGSTAQRVVEVQRTAPPPPPPGPPADRLSIDAEQAQPTELRQLAEGEGVDVAFRGTPGMLAEMRPAGHKAWQSMEEISPGRYTARLVLQGPRDIEPRPVELRLSARRGAALKGPRTLTARTRGAVGLWPGQVQRLALTGPEGAGLLHGLHTVRLGGPYLAELPEGVVLPLTGQVGEHYRVRLSADTEAWVPVAETKPAPSGTKPPRGAFTTVSVTVDAGTDVVSIPLAAPVPWSVQVGTAGTGRALLTLDLYGTHHAATWITHAARRQAVREVRVEQAAPGRVRVQVELQTAQAWGWRVVREAGALRLLVRHEPPRAPAGASPLQGLTVAVEAGHGSAANLGAVGATATPEKDINRWTADALKAELLAAGARVVDVRAGDENPGLRERAQRVVDAGAHLFVSVHANATDTSAGYLRGAGTSTFYKYAPWHDMAAAVQARLLQATGLPDFGLVGNFNYTPIRRATWAPAVLVEQAFVSNPAEEALLLDAEFRAQLARAVREGLEDFLRRQLPQTP